MAVQDTTIQANVNNYFFKTRADYEAHASEILNNSTIYIESDGEYGNVKMNLLWENPSPTSSFAAQSVSSSDTITNYDYFLVEYIITPGETNYHVQLMEKGCQLQFMNRQYSFYGNRDILIDITNNKFSFLDTYYGSSGTMNNGVLIPTKIIGLKIIPVSDSSGGGSQVSIVDWSLGGNA